MIVPADSTHRPQEAKAFGSARLIRAAHVTERLVDGELVLVDPTNGRIHALNPTASLVWLYCDGQHDEAYLSAELAKHYPESAGQIADDVSRLLETLLEERLVHLAD